MCAPGPARVTETYTRNAVATICTDSQSLLNKRAGETTLLWIPGHHGIAGNEEADVCAKQAAAITGGASRPVSFSAASALNHRILTDPPPCNCRTKEVYTKTFSRPADRRAASTRRDAVLLARLRAGHTPPQGLSMTGQSTRNALVAERSHKP